jgi:hypothetical protein
MKDYQGDHIPHDTGVEGSIPSLSTIKSIGYLLAILKAVFR